jgi:ketosteroid isomerase-like protein
MKHRAAFLIGLLMITATGTLLVHGGTPASEQQAISALVDSYPRYITQGDEKGFESLLLDQDIPFSSVSADKAIAGSVAIRHYQQFRDAVFRGDYKYRQTIANVHIEKMGPLAQVSLNFTVERLDGKNQSYTGWKILQLVKSNGAWKIASELYTFDLDESGDRRS